MVNQQHILDGNVTAIAAELRAQARESFAQGMDSAIRLEPAVRQAILGQWDESNTIDKFLIKAVNLLELCASSQSANRQG